MVLLMTYSIEVLSHINGGILPLSFFQKLVELFPGEVRIATLTSDDVFAGGWLTLAPRDRTTAYYEYLALNRNLSKVYPYISCLLGSGQLGPG